MTTKGDLLLDQCMWKNCTQLDGGFSVVKRGVGPCFFIETVNLLCAD